MNLPACLRSGYMDALKGGVGGAPLGAGGILTRKLQPRVSGGVAYAGWRVPSVSHVRLSALGLPVHHGQAQTQPLGVGLGSGTSQTQLYLKLSDDDEKRRHT